MTLFWGWVDMIFGACSLCVVAGYGLFWGLGLGLMMAYDGVMTTVL